MFILNVLWHARTTIFTSTAVVGSFNLYILKVFKTRESISFAIEYEFITYIERLDLQIEHRKGYKKIYFISALYLNLW